MEDKSLIFLISQPRSGSSLLQQLLNTSSLISSSPEPWQMLSLIHTYKTTKITDNYNPKFTNVNFIKYLNISNTGLNCFKNKIKELSLSLYNQNRQKDNFFLDKTPRYYHIINELYELFPNAKYIFLTRNPISVFSSILDYNFKGDYFELLKSNDRIDDLLLAPANLKNVIDKEENNILIKYEDIISSPIKEIKKIADYLALDLPKGTTYSLKGAFKDSFSIDTKSLQLHTTPVNDYLDSWKETINTTQKKKLVIGYLEKLKNINGIYSPSEIDSYLSNIKNHTPKKKTYFNLSFDMLTEKEENLSILAISKKRLQRKLYNNFKK